MLELLVQQWVHWPELVLRDWPELVLLELLGQQQVHWPELVLQDWCELAAGAAMGSLAGAGAAGLA